MSRNERLNQPDRTTKTDHGNPALMQKSESIPALSVFLRTLPKDRFLTLAELMAAFGARAHGGAILLLGLPEALPLPVPSLSAAFGIPLVMIAAHLVYFGDSGSLPRRVGELGVPRWLVAKLVDDLPPILVRVERLSRNRWIGLAERQRLLGIVCLYLSLLLLAPLPFFNSPPAICLVLLAWGMVQKDGVFVAVGLAGSDAVTAALVVILLWARSMLT